MASAPRRHCSTLLGDFINSGGKRYLVDSNHDFQDGLSTPLTSYLQNQSLPLKMAETCSMSRPPHQASSLHSQPFASIAPARKQPIELHRNSHTATIRMASSHFRYSEPPPEPDAAWSASTRSSLAPSMHTAQTSLPSHAEIAAHHTQDSTSESDQPGNGVSSSETATSSGSPGTSRTTNELSRRDISNFRLPNHLTIPRYPHKAKPSRLRVYRTGKLAHQSERTRSAKSMLQAVLEKYPAPPGQAVRETTRDVQNGEASEATDAETAPLLQPDPAGNDESAGTSTIPWSAWRNLIRSTRAIGSIRRDSGRDILGRPRQAVRVDSDDAQQPARRSGREGRSEREENVEDSGWTIPRSWYWLPRKKRYRE